MSESDREKTGCGVWHALFLLALILYAAFSLPRLFQPVSQEDLYWLVAAQTFHAEGVPREYVAPDVIAAYTPHLFLQCIVLAFNICGVNEPAARVPGFFMGLAAVALVFIITKALAGGPDRTRAKWAAIASLLCATTPALVQAPAIIDIDNTLLLPTTLLLCAAFAMYQKTPGLKWAAATAFAITLALWGRVTTPVVVSGVLFLYLLTRRQTRQAKLTFLGALLCGGLLFCLSWYVYCTSLGVPFDVPFAYALRAFRARARMSGTAALGRTARNGFFLVLWFGLMPVALILAVARLRWRVSRELENASAADPFFWCGCVVVVGYTFVGGVVYGYPKYHCPAMPLLYVFLALVMAQARGRASHLRWGPVVAVFVVAIALQIFVAGDLLHDWRYGVRAAVAGMRSPPVMTAGRAAAKTSFVCAACAACAALFWLCRRAGFRKHAVELLVIMSLAANIGTCVLQSTADYATGYTYGSRGAVEVADHLRARVPPQSAVLAPNEIIYYLRLPNCRYLMGAFWGDARVIGRRLADSDTAALVYSVPTNTVQGIRAIMQDKAIQQSLHENYNRETIGTYTVWLRKGLSTSN